MAEKEVAKKKERVIDGYPITNKRLKEELVKRGYVAKDVFGGNILGGNLGKLKTYVFDSSVEVEAKKILKEFIEEDNAKNVVAVIREPAKSEVQKVIPAKQVWNKETKSYN